MSLEIGSLIYIYVKEERVKKSRSHLKDTLSCRTMRAIANVCEA